jgi:hypothetical protein
MSEFNKSLRFSLSAPVNEGDTKDQTYGCRHTNPDICGSCNLDGVCAFVTSDHICRKPSAAWRKYFIKLSGE